MIGGGGAYWKDGMSINIHKNCSEFHFKVAHSHLFRAFLGNDDDGVSHVGSRRMKILNDCALGWVTMNSLVTGHREFSPMSLGLNAATE